MKPAPVEYVRPTSVEEAISWLAQHGDEAKVLAGGQSLVPLLSMRLARPTVLVDINHVDGTDNIGRSADGSAVVGARVRQAAFAGTSRLADLALPYVGHYVTRNRGTVCGSIAHADARAELPLALVALDGSVVATSERGQRTISARNFFLTHFTTALEPDELVVETVWPRLDGGTGCAFEEFALRTGDFALAMVAVVLRVEGVAGGSGHGGSGAGESSPGEGAPSARVADARIAVGAVVDRPTLLEDVADLVRGERIGPELARAAGEAVAAAVDPADSVHASAAYQRHLTALLVERGLLHAWEDATGAVP